MATVIDTLLIELGIDASRFSSDAQNAENQYKRLEDSVVKTEKAEKGATKTIKEHTEARRKSAVEHQKADAQLGSLVKTIGTAIKSFGAFTGMLLGASGLSKLAMDAAKANMELGNTAKNLGMASKELAAWRGAAEMAGGSAAGMGGYMQQLSGDIQSLIMQGDTSVLPYFNALGVSLLDSSGKARKLDDVMLDLADRMSGMDRQQAYNLAKQMGMDDGTANTLMRGRAEMERMLEIQRDMYHSSEADMENSRKLAEARAVLNARWESLKLMIGNALIPAVTFLTEKVSAFVEFLSKNEHLTKGVFIGMATAISLFLIPMLMTATAAVFAFIAPFAPLIAAVGALGAAFGLLYDDYKTWADGGKSLFDWGAFNGYINSSKVSTESLGKAFLYLTTGYTDWSSAANNLMDWLKLKGFIDQNGVSVDSLANGFRNLTSELRDSLMPHLRAIGSWFEKIRQGDFKGAWRDLEVGADRLWEKMVDGGKAVIGHVANAVDVATGHEIGTINNSTGGVVALGGGSAKDSFSAMIGRGEGGYNSVNLGQKFGYRAATRKLTSMTVADVYAMQKRREVNAVGKFQIIRDTMPEVIRGLKLTGREKFDEEMQERMGAWLLFHKRAGIGGYLKGKHSNRNLAGDEAAREWASLPVLSSRLVTGRYHSRRGSTAYSDGVNKAGHKAEHLEHALDRAREMYRQAKAQGMSDEVAEVYAFRGVNGSLSTRPLGGQAVAQNLQSQQPRIQAANNAANPQQVTNSQNTSITVNGGINVQTSSATVKGTVQDAMSGLGSRTNQYAVSQV